MTELGDYEECHGLLLRERAITAILVQALRKIELMSRDPLTVNEARKIINAVLLMVPIPGAGKAEPATMTCNHWPGQKRCQVCGMGVSLPAGERP